MGSKNDNSNKSYKKQFIIASAASLLLTLICLSPVLNNDFVNFDDNKMITENRVVTHPNQYGFEYIIDFQRFQAHYKPLVVLMWQWEYKNWGADPFVFHGINLLLHLLTTLLVFAVIKSIFDHKNPSGKLNNIYFAFFGSLLFGIHPLHVESIAWATERKDVLFGFFFMAGMLTYIISFDQKRHKWLWLAISFLSYGLSMASKSPGITLIAVFIIIDFLFHRKFSRTLVLEKLPFLILFVFFLYQYGIISRFDQQAVGLVGGIVNKGGGEQADNLAGLPAFYRRILIISYRFIFWIVHTLIPVKLAVAYPRKTLVEAVGIFIHLLPWISLTLLSTVYFLRKNRILIFGLLFYAITISPALAISDRGTGIFVADRYAYIPLLGLLMILLYGLHQLPSKKLSFKAKIALMVFVCFVLGIQTFERSQVWKNSKTLFTDVIKKYPNQVPVAYNNVGLYYKNKGEHKKAMPYFKRSTEFSNYYQSFNNLANTHFALGQYKKAIPIYTKALEFKPGASELYGNRGACYFQIGKPEKALRDMTKALQIRPNFTDALKNRILVYLSMKRYQEALKDQKRYLKLIPEDPDVWHLQAIALQNLKRYEDALVSINQAIKLKPNNGVFYRLRAYIHYFQKSYDQARKDLEKAAELGIQPPQDLKNALAHVK